MKKIFLLLLSCIVISCNNNDDEPFVSINMLNEVILEGRLSIDNQFNQNGENFVVSNSLDHDELVSKIQSSLVGAYQNNNYSAPVDFNLSDIICIVSEIQPTLENRLVIDSIIENQDNIVVTYHIALGLGDLPANEQLCFLLRVPKLTKPVIFEDITP